jgi:PAS domain S-box-containing protein
MKRPLPRASGSRRIAELEARLEEAEETLRAIRSGEVDAIVVSGTKGERIFTLKGADRPYRRLVETMNEGAATLSEQGTIRYCNGRFAAMLGHPLEQVMGGVMRDHVPDEHLAKFDALVRSGWEAGTSKGEMSFRKADGTSVEVYLSVSALPEEERVLCVIATDVTELSSLKQAVAMRDQFISVASHEFKTPLTSLMLVVESVERALENLPRAPAVMRRKMTTISRQARRLTQLVGNLLDVSRIQAGRLHLTVEQVDLCEVVRDVAERYSEEAAHASCPLQVTASEPITGAWDHSRVDQIVSNLLSNAIKYGAGHPVSIVAESNGDTARLSVTDGGIGIAPENQERIFQRFERAVAPDEFGGMGLGLWIAREIVTRLGGSIRVESRIGAGSRFTVELPVRSVLPGEPGARDEDGRGPEGEGHGPSAAGG